MVWWEAVLLVVGGFAAGFVNAVYPDHATMLDAVMGVAAEIASKSPMAVWGTKQTMNFARDHSVADSLEYIANWNAAMFDTDDMAEAFAKALGRDSPLGPDRLVAVGPVIGRTLLGDLPPLMHLDLAIETQGEVADAEERIDCRPVRPGRAGEMQEPALVAGGDPLERDVDDVPLAGDQRRHGGGRTPLVPEEC